MAHRQKGKGKNKNVSIAFPFGDARMILYKDRL